jgi:hypothetical protein
MLEIRGTAAVVESGGKAINDRFEEAIVRIKPARIIAYGIDSSDSGMQARSVGPA